MSTTPERFAQIKEPLLAARELLAKDDSARPLLDEGIVKLRPQSKLPERIGIYEIEAILGEGGMGVVYRARQEEPIRRQVALKLIRRGMHSESVVRRYAVGGGSPIEGFGTRLVEPKGLADDTAKEIEAMGAKYEGREWRCGGQRSRLLDQGLELPLDVSPPRLV